MERTKESVTTRPARQIFLPARRAANHGGTIINIITAIVFFGLIALGVLWVIKNIGQASQQYTDGMIKTQNKAVNVKCQMNLRTIAQNIQIYALSNDSFPPSLQALIEFCGSTQLFRQKSEAGPACSAGAAIPREAGPTSSRCMLPAAKGAGDCARRPASSVS